MGCKLPVIKVRWGIETTLLTGPVNFSEGRRPEVINAIARAAGHFCHLLHVHSDFDHNRSVITLAGDAERLIEGIVSAAGVAMRLIDLNRHRGVHPRLGVVDVVPFVPVPGAGPDGEAMERAVAASLLCARRIWAELGIPCFLYELSAGKGKELPLPLPDVRRRAFKDLTPDLGGPEPHPSAGAVVVGARRVMVAFNVVLDSTDLSLAVRIATDLRKGVPDLRALGVPLASRGVVQVSCNLTRPSRTTMADVFRAVSERAAANGVEVLESELVGLAPRAAFGGEGFHELKFSKQPVTLEECLAHLQEGNRRVPSESRPGSP